jgi:hypothetical protein
MTYDNACMELLQGHNINNLTTTFKPYWVGNFDRFVDIDIYIMPSAPAGSAAQRHHVEDQKKPERYQHCISE